MYIDVDRESLIRDNVDSIPKLAFDTECPLLAVYVDGGSRGCPCAVRGLATLQTTKNLQLLAKHADILVSCSVSKFSSRSGLPKEIGKVEVIGVWHSHSHRILRVGFPLAPSSIHRPKVIAGMSPRFGTYYMYSFAFPSFYLAYSTQLTSSSHLCHETPERGVYQSQDGHTLHVINKCKPRKHGVRPSVRE